MKQTVDYGLTGLYNKLERKDLGECKHPSVAGATTMGAQTIHSTPPSSPHPFIFTVRLYIEKLLEQNAARD